MTDGELLEADFRDLTAKIHRDRGFACGSYKEKCVRRRIAVRMRARGVHSYPDYAAVLDSDAGEYDRLLDALTINVTKLFRNREVYEQIARDVIPLLWESREREIRVWSAGCSSGEEAYSLAILFHRHALARGERDRLGRVRIVGTDIDRDSLETAEHATYPEAAFVETPPDIRAAYFSEAPSQVIPEVRSLVRFERRDLLGHAPFAGTCQLAVCRNVVIYFDRESQERVFENFHHALLPGGFLVLGKVETLLGAARTLFVPVDARNRIFRMP